LHSWFSVELKEAGEGTLEISINGPSGQNIPNSVVSLGPAQFEVAYTPVESGQHRANITFNKENVSGMVTCKIVSLRIPVTSSHKQTIFHNLGLFHETFQQVQFSYHRIFNVVRYCC